jgi:hypothetical protein
MSETDFPNALDIEGQKTGPWSEDDPHGGVMRGSYLAGERHGTWRHFFADGRVRAEGTYDRGVLHGAWTWYRATGDSCRRDRLTLGKSTGCGSGGIPTVASSTPPPGNTARSASHPVPEPQDREVHWLELYNAPPRPIGERIDLEVWLPVR